MERIKTWADSNREKLWFCIALNLIVLLFCLALMRPEFDSNDDMNIALFVNSKAAEYAQLQQSVTAAAERGYVDTVIKAEDTRKMVIGAFEMLYTKAEERPDKKHGTV